jgi:hypothetical protein
MVDISLTQRERTSIVRFAKAQRRAINDFLDKTKTVASRNEMIVEIISLFAFTFKIPFH